MSNSINDIIQILQISIAPTVLISGIGLIILSLNTRSSLIMDRIRAMVLEYTKTKEQFIKEEIDWLYKRVRILKTSIYYLVLCIIIDVLVIISIFTIKLFAIENGIIIPILFICSITCMTIGLIAFLHDINMNLKALKIEIKHRIKE